MGVAPWKIVVVGMGPIGCAVAKAIADAPDLELAGAIDPAGDLVGRDVGKLIGRPGVRGVKVTPELTASLARRARAAVHAAGSRFPDSLPLLRDLVRHGLGVVSTCEELVAARVRWPRLAGRLDRECRQAGRAVLLGGINPGYLMDVLPVSMASACTEVRSLRVTRYVDTGRRRGALQRKTAAGMAVAEFRTRASAGKIGHVGLSDSLLYVVDRLRLGPVDIKETIAPIVAQKAFRKGALVVPRGRAAGVHQTVTARRKRGGGTVAVLDLKMAVGLAEPYDEIRITGTPPVRMRIDGGVHGDSGTVARVLTGLRALREEPPGFRL